jgi:hypothetical protein
MLPKQVWSLLDKPDSLCVRALKAKYYPNSVKNGSSSTWQSIELGIQTFKRGYMWRINDGQEVDIWNDPWIPSSSSSEIMTLRGPVILFKVSELIDLVSDQ